MSLRFTPNYNNFSKSINNDNFITSELGGRN